MKKVLRIVVPIFMLLIFILVMTTGGIVKKPLNDSEDVVAYALAIRDNVAQAKWDNATENMTSLEEAWNKIRFRIQFSIEGNRMYEFEAILSQLKGAINARSEVMTIMQLESLMGEWDRLEE